MKQYFKAIFSGYSEICLLKNYSLGLLILVMSLINPNVALSGIIAVAAAYLFARLINVDQGFLKLGFYTYNPLLVGLAIGYLFKLSPMMILFLITAGIFTFIITMTMYNLFATYLRLPVLSLPFVIVSTIAYLASANYVNLPLNEWYLVDNLAPYLPLWLSGYFESLGAIFFMPHVLAGLIFALGILATSRILFLLSVVGYYTGVTFTALMVGSFGQALGDINHFNCILIAMAVGGIFLIPSVKSYLLAVIAVCVSTVLLDSVTIFWSQAGIPGFTLPFNLVLLTLIYVLGLVNYPHLVQLGQSTPEETLDLYLANQGRYQGDTSRTLMLPFSGKWTVWQGFEGQWTHQGAWKYAYDFIITDEDGQSHRDGGNYLGDYYAYRKPVLSPVSGQVIKVIDHLPDNPIGQVDRTNNWGNLVIIQDERGFFVEISHFAQASIQVTEGDWVERGTFLGLCGNSGYSPQPHIHLQVQLTGIVGAYTVPFSFVSYANDNQFHTNELPPEDTRVEPLYGDKNLAGKTSFILDEVYHYDLFKDNQKIDDLTLTVKMAPDGTFYFDSGRGKLYFGQYEGQFFNYRVEGRDPYLQAMLLALPRLPLAGRENLQWSDQVPIGSALRGWQRAAVQFISSFSHNFAQIRADLKWTHKNKIEGTIHSPTLKLDKKTLVEWDHQRGFKTIKVDNVELRRVDS